MVKEVPSMSCAVLFADGLLPAFGEEDDPVLRYIQNAA